MGGASGRPCRRTGQDRPGASQGRTPRHGLAGRPRARPGPGGGGPAGAAWGGLGLPPPAPALLPFGSRATRGGQGGASSPVPCREAERRSAAGPRPSRLAHAHATSGGTEGARCSARGSPHRHPVTPSPRVTLRHRGLAVRPRPQPLVLGPALRPPAPRLSCPLARGRLIHPVLWLFLNIASQGPI